MPFVTPFNQDANNTVIITLTYDIERRAKAGHRLHLKVGRGFTRAPLAVTIDQQQGDPFRQVMNMNFVHLHVHSNFSFERGTADILKLLQRCSQLGMGTVSLTDYDGLYGAIRLFRHAREVGIKPIIGTELTLTGNHQILLLAKNQDGYSNLCRLISNMRLSTKGLPVCTFELLTKYSRNLIALSGGPSGEIAQLILMGEKLASENALQKYLDIFGVDNFYLEVQDHLLAWERVLNSQQSALAKNFGVGIVATNNVHFLHREEFNLHKALVLTGKAVHHRTGQPKPNSEFYLKSTEEMTTLFRDFPGGK